MHPRKTIKLSGAFPEECGKMTVEVVVKVINVNHKEGAEILKRCRTLEEYSKFIGMIRDKQDTGISNKTAIEEIREED
ncbi:MAG: hypothetical protein GX663_00670 [Clostridiales bacterium]|nr:hypothetical protein [Clostridiales bacterium]